MVTKLIIIKLRRITNLHTVKGKKKMLLLLVVLIIYHVST